MNGVLTVHVDDLKFSALTDLIKETLKALEAKFGKLTITWSEFTNTRIHHRKEENGDTTLDQDAYINALCQVVLSGISRTTS